MEEEFIMLNACQKIKKMSLLVDAIYPYIPFTIGSTGLIFDIRL